MRERVVRVQALKNFDGHNVGDAFDMIMDMATASLVAGDYLKVVDDPLWHVFVSTEPPSEYKP